VEGDEPDRVWRKRRMIGERQTLGLYFPVCIFVHIGYGNRRASGPPVPGRTQERMGEPLSSSGSGWGLSD